MILPVALATNGQAAEIWTERSDLGRLRFATLVVHVDGEIVAGDAERLRAVLATEVQEKQRGIFFAFDSPGGNLIEGVKIGRLIAEVPEITTALVGTPSQPEAICASACIFAYLGAQTREKSPEGRIGVHQFSIPAEDMKGEEGLSLGQQASAIIGSYLAERGASAEIFDRMVLTPPGEIDWVPDADLAALGITGGKVVRQTSEFINNQGKVALRMDFESSEGAHMLVLGCNDPGVYMVASIAALDDEVSLSGAALILDDAPIEPTHVEVMGFKNRQVVILFVMSPADAIAATKADKIGAYFFDDKAQSWIGNMQDIDHGKFSDIVGSCVS